MACSHRVNPLVSCCAYGLVDHSIGNFVSHHVGHLAFRRVCRRGSNRLYWETEMIEKRQRGLEGL